MKINYLFSSIFFFVALNAGATTATLTAWVGKYPSSKIDGKTANEILLNSGFLKKILPPNETTLIKSFTTEDLITQDGEYTLIFKCKPHDCPSNHSMIIEKSNGELWVGIYQNKSGFISTRWYGTSEHTTLPISVQKSFIHGHTPE